MPDRGWNELHWPWEVPPWYRPWWKRLFRGAQTPLPPHPRKERKNLKIEELETATRLKAEIDELTKGAEMANALAALSAGAYFNGHSGENLTVLSRRCGMELSELIPVVSKALYIRAIAETQDRRGKLRALGVDV